MTKAEKNLLTHLKPMTEYADIYFCGIAKNNKDFYMDTVEEKIKVWVEKNGGKFQHIKGKHYVGNRKGYLVKIVFPTYNDQKQTMANLK